MELLTQFEPALQALKALGARGAQLEEQVKELQTRTEEKRTGFQTSSRDLVPRCQALLAKFGKTQAAVQTSFAHTSTQVRNFRGRINELYQQCETDAQRLFEAIGRLQTEHDTLHLAAQEMEETTKRSVYDHGVAVQDRMQQIAPKLETLDETLGKKIVPAAQTLGKEVATQTTGLSRHVETTVVPALLKQTDELGRHLEESATQVKNKAQQLATEVETRTEALMREALASAQRIHTESNSRLLRLAGVIPADIEAIFTLIKEIQRAMRGLHMNARKATGVLDVILEIVSDLVQLLKDIEAGATY